MRHPSARTVFSVTRIAGVSAAAAVVFEVLSFARSVLQAASVVIEQVALQLTEVTGAGADSARDVIHIFGKLGQLLSEAADLVMDGMSVLLAGTVRGLRAC
eukprot:3597063-Alexandrium_andersonii.AAC.1